MGAQMPDLREKYVLARRSDIEWMNCNAQKVNGIWVCSLHRIPLHSTFLMRIICTKPVSQIFPVAHIYCDTCIPIPFTSEQSGNAPLVLSHVVRTPLDLQEIDPPLHLQPLRVFTKGVERNLPAIYELLKKEHWHHLPV